MRKPKPRITDLDPLLPLHIRVPKSTIATFNNIASKRNRSAVYLYREALNRAAVEYRKHGVTAGGKVAELDVVEGKRGN